MCRIRILSNLEGNGHQSKSSSSGNLLSLSGSVLGAFLLIWDVLRAVARSAVSLLAVPPDVDGSFSA